MAKKATSSHFKQALYGAEGHNERRKQINYARSDLAHQNEIWNSPDFVSVEDARRKVAKRYKDAHGKKLPSNATPIQETVVVIASGTTMEQLLFLKRKMKDIWGFNVLQIAAHRDEGHWGVLKKGQKAEDYSESRVRNGVTEYWKPNLHAHIIIDTTDERGETLNPLSDKLRRQQQRKWEMEEAARAKKEGREPHPFVAPAAWAKPSFDYMQDLTAECLQMARGKSDPDKKHRSAYDQVIFAQQQEIAANDKALEAQKERIEAVPAKVKEVGAAAIEGLHNLLQPGKARRQQTAQIEAARADERAKVIDEVQKAAGLTLPDATAESIGKNWGGWYNAAVQRGKDLKTATKENQDLKQKAKEDKKGRDDLFKSYVDTLNEKAELTRKVEDQVQELDAWRSGLLVRAIDAIARYVKSLVYRLSPKERDDIAQAAVKITPHGLYTLATAQLPAESAKRAENAISSAINGDAEKVETTAQKAGSRSMIRLNVEGIEIEMSQKTIDIISDEVAKFPESEKTSVNIVNAAILLAIEYVNEATTYAESHGGGGGGSMTGWGRKKDEDDEAWLRRCANTAHSIMQPKTKYKFKR